MRAGDHEGMIHSGKGGFYSAYSLPRCILGYREIQALWEFLKLPVMSEGADWSFSGPARGGVRMDTATVQGGTLIQVTHTTHTVRNPLVFSGATKHCRDRCGFGLSRKDKCTIKARRGKRCWGVLFKFQFNQFQLHSQGCLCLLELRILQAGFHLFKCLLLSLLRNKVVA